VPGNALLGDDDTDVDVELAEWPDAGIVPGRLPGNGEWLRDITMTKFLKMACERFS
jgi:hypothetical protein